VARHRFAGILDDCFCLDRESVRQPDAGVASEAKAQDT